ncbi:MAG: PAC2 family protein [Candidatus Lokiarchaeota archaeon]|nr:PAC2 family protein [Candidatus Lokiarchaeota archaeon]
MIKIVSDNPIKGEEVAGTDITLISGLAGICSVGRIAVQSLITQFEARLVASMYPDDLPAQVAVDGNGRMILPVVQVYLARPVPRRSFLLVTGEYQPSSNAGMFNFVDSLMVHLLKEQGLKVTLSISIGAYLVEHVPVEPKVFISGTDDAVVAELLAIDKGVMRLMENGLISGANGLIPAWGALLGLPGVCLLAETIPVVKRDPKAAKLVIELLSKRFGFPFDCTSLGKEIEEVEALMAELKGGTRNAGDIIDQSARRDRQSYIG